MSQLIRNFHLSKSMHLKMRSLEIFHLFAQTGNVTETARLLRVSQPAVSQALRDLEGEVGAPLFVKVGRRLQLTAEGNRFLPDVEKLISQMAAVRSRAANLRNHRTETLSIASIPTLAHSVLPRTISQFRAARPNVRLRLGSHTASEVVRQIRSESADIGLTFLPINDRDVKTRPLMRTAIACLVAEGSALSRERLVIPERLLHDIVIAQGAGTPPGFVLRDWFERVGFADWPDLEVNQSTLALYLAEHQVGVALAHPLVLSFGAAGKVVAIPFEPEIALTLAMVRPRHGHESPVVQEFVEIMRSDLDELSRSLVRRGLVGQIL